MRATYLRPGSPPLSLRQRSSLSLNTVANWTAEGVTLADECLHLPGWIDERCCCGVWSCDKQVTGVSPWPPLPWPGEVCGCSLYLQFYLHFLDLVFLTLVMCKPAMYLNILHTLSQSKELIFCTFGDVLHAFFDGCPASAAVVQQECDYGAIEIVA